MLNMGCFKAVGDMTMGNLGKATVIGRHIYFSSILCFLTFKITLQ